MLGYCIHTLMIKHAYTHYAISLCLIVTKQLLFISSTSLLLASTCLAFLILVDLLFLPSIVADKCLFVILLFVLSHLAS